MRFHLDHAFHKTVLSLCLTVTIVVLNSILYSDESL